MRVALLSYEWGEYCIRIAGGLTKYAQVILLLPKQLAAPHLSKLTSAVEFCPFHKPRLRQPLQQMKTACKIIRSIKHFNPDVIHIQQGHLWFNLVSPLLSRYPLVMTIHDPRHHLGDKGSRKTPRKVYDIGFRRAAQIIVHTKAMKQMVIDQIGVSSEILHVIPHVYLGEETLQSQVKEDDHLILFFGRIWKYKGLEYLIKAEPLITAKVPQARIIIAGMGEDFSRYRRMMVNPERFIVHNEYVSLDKRKEIFQQASVVVLPYVEATQSGVIPLAYAFAKPVVVTSVGGLSEMVEHGRTGYLVPPRDEIALADAIVRLLQDNSLRHRLGAYGKWKIHAECSPAVIAQQTLAVYELAISGGYQSAIWK
jgi:glycosyltransferase involved in cell wall biosynthesis